ncbi:DUF4381 domain-containing protein [Aliiroseovarius sp. 2305UL8-7]|uniref:DUF4381 domain-containing protein n=1 Tax=Aliiroseovarius conchicola TaxID=3121637 RepID=UPI003527B113
MTLELSPEMLAQLEKLRDIHLPEQIGWWPLAPGWWILLASTCAAVLAALAWNILRKHTTRYLALRELDQITDQDPIAFATNLSVLLRRVAISKDASNGQLKDQNWVSFLTETGLSPDLATHLAEAPYAPLAENAPPASALRDAAAQWIRRQA